MNDDVLKAQQVQNGLVNNQLDNLTVGETKEDFATRMLQFCKTEYAKPHGSVALIVFKIDFENDVKVGNKIVDTFNKWAESSECFWFDYTMTDDGWKEIADWLAGHDGQEWAMTLVVEDTDGGGAHFHPTRPDPPQFIKDFTQDLYVSYRAWQLEQN
jgi:hypothetical protein